MTGKELLELKQAIQKGERLSDEQVARLATLRREANLEKRHVAVSKISLREGEELMDFVWTMMDAVQTNRIILADGSLDAWLHGIFDDHVIVQDGNTGKFFKSTFSRNASGEIEFTEPVEVRMVWVPAETPAEGEVDEVERAICKRAPQDLRVVEVSKAAESKWGFLPNALRGR